LTLQAVVSLLLSSGANPNARDNLGSSALLEAVKAGQAALLGSLVGAGAALQLSNSELSSALCSMVMEENAGLLRRYIAAGAYVAAGDYNQQTPLHIAAVQGKLEMVSTRCMPWWCPCRAGCSADWPRLKNSVA
jgi:ankyrin repeat protein